ncbi:MAG TPA: HAD-IIIA family hydrolase [Bacteroidales bacterium]|nr:HAD-IIIA family hydrolase [Bacteroidales bacterium]HPE56612.1 HAD-IIIA family hydrolase [Bacteroidales bacterium]HRX96626.1 HAD-IIIA family hydrolase [Bacteroidales bacterium]
MSNYKTELKNITTFIFDYDGVLTNGSVILQPDGEALRTANVKDGFALQLAVKMGYNVAIISGGRSLSMNKRFEALNITDFYLGVSDKIAVFNKYLAKKEVQNSQVLYMGDDIPDYKPMIASAIPCCPADAAPEIKAISKYISHLPGGRGCVRDVIEQVLKVQGKWMTDEGFSW